MSFVNPIALRKTKIAYNFGLLHTILAFLSAIWVRDFNIYNENDQEIYQIYDLVFIQLIQWVSKGESFLKITLMLVQRDSYLESYLKFS